MSKTKLKTKTKRTTRPKEEVIFNYWNHDGLVLYEAPSFMYEVYTYRGDNHVYQLLDSKTVSSPTIKDKLSVYSQNRRYYEVVYYGLVGAPVKWLEQNRFVKTYDT